MARDGWMFIIPLCCIAIICLLLDQWMPGIIWSVLAGGFGVLILCIGFFFRDPSRTIPEGEDLILSGGDGKVVAIKELDYEPFIDGPAIQISVFLSVLNVHINRIPCTGVIKHRQLLKGKYELAYKDEASNANEQLALGIENGRGRVVIKQIVGFIARRIVCYVQEGDQVHTGEKYGLIRFGSRIDIIVPPQTTVHTKIGDHVKGGETILGVLR